MKEDPAEMNETGLGIRQAQIDDIPQIVDLNAGTFYERLGFQATSLSLEVELV